MRNPINSLNEKRIYFLCLLSTAFLWSALPDLYGQECSSITGKLADQSNHVSIPYANVGLYTSSDLKLIHGLISDTSGYFTFSNVNPGKYYLRISMIGYDPISKEIDIPLNTRYDAGVVLMNQGTVTFRETIVVADRVKGRVEKDRTAYFVTKKMAETSNNGLDLIKLIPGVQVDLMRNISLDGNQNILVLVDGKERDKNYVSQIIPDQVDKVEILNAPPSGYDGDITGVINIVLKKEKKQGISGQINMEIPSSASLFYIHPDYNFSVVFKKLNLFTSYNGEMIHFEQHESILREIKKDEGTFETRSDQYVDQKTWSHRFHYGFDYYCGPKTLINFYAYYNPYSQEYDGQAKAVSDLNNNGQWQALRNTSDMNRSNFYSLYFKHSFKESGVELTFDISNYHLLGENVASYIRDSDGSAEIRNSSKLIQNALNIKTDFMIPFEHNITINAGVRMRTYDMQDKKESDFRYSGDIFSAYATFSHTLSGFDWNLGFRVEKSISELRQGFRKSFLNLLPSASLSYKISSDQTLKFAVSNTINRPNIYQLNPNLSMDDPYTIRQGNPSLDPEFRMAISLEYSRKFKTNFGAVRLFYNRIGNSINYLTLLNEASVYEIRIDNLGTLHQSGFQFTGTFKAGRIINFIPTLRLYAQFTDGNRLAGEYSIKNRSQIVAEPGFSAVLSFSHNINFGMTFQYSSPKNNVCGTSFGDPLYFISLYKTFKNRIKAGIVSALPFTRTFTYQGSEVKSRDLYVRYAGDIQLSKALFSLKLSYQFNSSGKQEIIHPAHEDTESVPKKGF
jgi:hypothetical protein